MAERSRDPDDALRPADTGRDRLPRLNDDPPAPAKVCPECGQSLGNVDLELHAGLHWPDVSFLHDPVYRRSHARAIERRQQLVDGGVTPDAYAASQRTEEE